MLLSLLTICLAVCSNGLVTASPVISTTIEAEPRLGGPTGPTANEAAFGFVPQPRSRQASRAAIVARAKSGLHKRQAAPSNPAVSCTYTFDASATPVAMFGSANWASVSQQHSALASIFWRKADCIVWEYAIDAWRTSCKPRRVCQAMLQSWQVSIESSIDR